MNVQRFGLLLAAGFVVGASVSFAPPAHAIYRGTTATAPQGAVSLLNTPGAWSLSAPTHACSGALIAPRWVVTAKHCVKGHTFSGVRAGSIYRNQGTLVPVARQVASPTADVGLVELAADAPGPYLAWSAQRPAIGAAAVTRGFGNTLSKGSGEASPTLKQVNSRVTGFIVDSEYGGDLVQHSFIDGETRGGDSGGPMMVNGVLIGPHSGLFGGQGGAASLASTADWVQQVTGISPVGASAGSSASATVRPTTSAVAAPAPSAPAAPTSAPQVPATSAPVIVPSVSVRPSTPAPVRSVTPAPTRVATPAVQAPWWMQVQSWFKGMGW